MPVRKHPGVEARALAGRDKSSRSSRGNEALISDFEISNLRSEIPFPFLDRWGERPREPLTQNPKGVQSFSPGLRDSESATLGPRYNFLFTFERSEASAASII